jgi:aspartyl-tRNA synthetase
LISSLGLQIKAAKDAKKANAEWDPLLREMLAAKATYQSVTGQSFGQPSGSASAVDSEAAAAQQQQEQQESSDKNKEKNAAKAAAKAEKEAKKAANRAKRAAEEQAKADRLAGIGQDNFGDMSMVQSTPPSDKVWTRISSARGCSFWSVRACIASRALRSSLNPSRLP